jgi:hypothetical protein
MGRLIHKGPRILLVGYHKCDLSHTTRRFFIHFEFARCLGWTDQKRVLPGLPALGPTPMHWRHSRLLGVPADDIRVRDSPRLGHPGSSLLPKAMSGFGRTATIEWIADVPQSPGERLDRADSGHSPIYPELRADRFEWKRLPGNHHPPGLSQGDLKPTDPACCPVDLGLACRRIASVSASLSKRKDRTATYHPLHRRRRDLSAGSR